MSLVSLRTHVVLTATALLMSLSCFAYDINQLARVKSAVLRAKRVASNEQQGVI
ncbi:MAG: hypothetical protein HQK53_05890 [Oligoflexia bacterium]|nr:hypothetical protein [Oligoflexia bacterium]